MTYGANSVGKLYSPKKAGFDVYFEHKDYPGISIVTNKKDEDGKSRLFPKANWDGTTMVIGDTGNTLLKVVLFSLLC